VSTSSDGPMILQSPSLARHPEVVHGFCGRPGGVSPTPFDSLNLSAAVGDDPSNVRANLERVAAQTGVAADRFVFMNQVHENAVRVVHERDLHRYRDAWPEVDALVTDRKGLALCVRTADCLPVLLYDKQAGAVAAVHAGWRGIAGGVLQATVGELSSRFGASPKRVYAALGPCIRPCCYRVGQDVAWAFREYRTDPGVLAPASGKGGWTLDLAAAARSILRKLGVKSDRIDSMDLCTSCERKEFFSHRRDGAPTGRMLNFVGMW